MTQEIAQSLAYEKALQLASRHSWKAVLDMLMQDGFSAKMDYVSLLELWELSNSTFEPHQALEI